MGTIIASTICARAATLLQDATGVRWPADELINWLNDGQRVVVLLKPNAYTKNTIKQLDPGTKQTLPADAIGLTDVIRNMGTSGTTPGRAVRIAMREILDAQLPDWHSAAPTSAVVHYLYTPMDQKTFYVYPPQPSATRGYIELSYSASPADVVLSSPITIDDIYQSVLIDYIMYRAYSKDVEYAADVANASKYENAYIAALTGKIRGEMMTNPNASAPANPNMMAGRGQ